MPAAIAIAAVAVAGSDYDRPEIDERADNVSQSFIRMLAHDPYYAPTAGVAATPEDPLAAHDYAVLRDESARRRALAGAVRYVRQETLKSAGSIR